MSKLEQKRLIERYLETISDLSGYPISKEEAEKSDKRYFLFVEYAESYGGYRLVLVNVEKGSHCGVFGGTSCEPRMKAPVFVAYLQGLVYGMEHMKRNEQTNG